MNFENIYSATGKATFKFNARNVSLANFFASDVVKAQLAFIHSKPGLAKTSNVKVVERENVVSVNGSEWRERHPGWGVMRPPALQDFLRNTDNGKSTVNAFKGAYTVSSAEVVPYEGGGPDAWSVKIRMQPV